MRKDSERFSLSVHMELGAVIRRIAADCDLRVSQLVRAGIDHWVTMNAHRIDPEVYEKYTKLRHLDVGQDYNT